MENHFVKALEKISLPPLPQRGSYLSPTHSYGAPSIWGLICIFSIGSEYLVLESIFTRPADLAVPGVREGSA